MVNYTNTNPKLPTRQEENAAIPRKIFLKRNIDYVTRPQKRSQGFFNTGNNNGAIDLYNAIQTSLNRSWIDVGSASVTDPTTASTSTLQTALTNIYGGGGGGNGIYGGSGALTAGTTVTMGANTLDLSGDFITFDLPNSGSGIVSLISQPSAFNSSTLSLNPTDNAGLTYRIDANNHRIVKADASSLTLEGSQAGVTYDYSFPNVNPTSDGTAYVLSWTNNSPSFQNIQEATMNDSTDILSVQRITSPFNSVTNNTKVKKRTVSGEDLASSNTFTLVTMPTDMALNAEGMPVYWSVRGSVHDVTTNAGFEINDSAQSLVEARMIDAAGNPRLQIENGRANAIDYAVIFEYLAVTP